MNKFDFTSFLRFGIILLFVFFLNSGSLKWITIFPFDATIFFAIPLVLIISAYWKFSKKLVYKPSLILIISFISLFVWILITCFFTVSEEYYMVKISRTLLIYLAFFFPIIYFKDYSYFNYFVYGISIFVTIVIIILSGVLIIYGNFDIFFIATDLEDLNIPDYLVISEILGVFIFLNHSRNSKRILFLKLTALCYMILLGGRGPIFFLVIIYIIYYLLKTKLTFHKSILVILIPFLFISSLSFFQNWGLTNRTFSRFSTLIEGDSFESRGELLQVSTTILKENFLFGTGYGGFGMAALGRDFRAYPHNIILEVFVETGLIGLLIFLFFIVYFFARIFVRMISNKEDVCTFDFSLSFTYLFLNAMKSSSFIDVRNLFGLMGIIVAYYMIEYNEKRSRTLT